MSVGPVPSQVAMVEPESAQMAARKLTAAWLAWFGQLILFVKPLGGSGTTANRPTRDLYVGLLYFDTTLGFPVYVKTVATPAVWVRYDGTVV